MINESMYNNFDKTELNFISIIINYYKIINNQWYQTIN